MYVPCSCVSHHRVCCGNATKPYMGIAMYMHESACYNYIDMYMFALSVGCKQVRVGNSITAVVSADQCGQNYLTMYVGSIPFPMPDCD